MEKAPVETLLLKIHEDIGRINATLEGFRQSINDLEVDTKQLKTDSIDNKILKAKIGGAVIVLMCVWTAFTTFIGWILPSVFEKFHS